MAPDIPTIKHVEPNDAHSADRREPNPSSLVSVNSGRAMIVSNDVAEDKKREAGDHEGPGVPAPVQLEA
jgi:hypothetical protein